MGRNVHNNYGEGITIERLQELEELKKQEEAAAKESDASLDSEAKEEVVSEVVVAPKKNNKNFKPIIIGVCIVLVVCSITFGIVKLLTKDAKIDDAPTENKLTKREQEIIGVKDEKEPEIEKVPEKITTPEYKEYENLTEEEKKDVVVIPREEEVPKEEIEEIIKEQEEEIKKEEIKTIPEAFNLKDVIDIKMNNQYSYGLCWAFASLNSLETYLALNEKKDYDLSEIHLDYAMSNKALGWRVPHNGGSFELFEDYMRVFTAVEEDKTEYRDYSDDEVEDLLRMKSNIRATKTVKFPAVRKEKGVAVNYTEEELEVFRNAVKKHIMTNGSLYTSIKSSATFNSYCSENCYTNHAVSIIGWDDNYSKENFTDDNGNHPIHDGAYIIENSWGDFYDGKSYYYISYDDQQVEVTLSGVTSASENDLMKFSDLKNEKLKKYLLENNGAMVIEKDGIQYLSDIAVNKIFSLNLSNMNLTDNDIKDLTMFKKLSNLDLSNNDITDISPLADIPNMYHLDISDTKVTDLSSLSDSKLQSLKANNDKGIKGYSAFENLFSLELENCDIDELEDISSFKELTSLDISGNKDINFIDMIPKDVYMLNVSNTNFDKIDLLNDFNNIMDLNISYNNISSLNNFKKLNNLFVLDISGNNITDISPLYDINKGVNFEEEYDYFVESTGGFEDEEFSSSMYILKMNDMKLDDITVVNIINVPTIQLKDNKFTDISKFDNKTVTDLDLSGNKNIVGLESIKNVNYVSLSNCNISELNEVLKLKNVYSLDLSNNKITDVSEFNDLVKLNSLTLENNGKLKGKISNALGGLNIANNDIDELEYNTSELHYLKKDNITYDEYVNYLKNNNYLVIVSDELKLNEEQFDAINKIDGYVSFDNLVLEINTSLDESGNIDLTNYFKKNDLGPYIFNNRIKNGIYNYFDNNIKVLDPDLGYVRFDEVYSNNFYYSTVINFE